ncbi:hypothetical protein H257_05495 [Aphanomyces astaci]|uniref:Transposase Tc1-like domain-containing protein n=1 Tax=Aphanomyces astaci TaxID=112090 RepID=W4GRJ2_APHAT|nr:hypothetical protein H257_05495 [Aphanomyces astaci]ETV81956.1 hypothetical protein H257_05495 [Aphanomyces astaci]|eukprot:XP_009828693.1 hypothetical protein H257_05495 [Aphanomyces astaci]
MSPAPRSTRELTPGMKMEVVFALQDAIHNGKLARAGRATVRKIWRDFKSGSKASKKKGRVGPKPRHSPAEVTEIVRSVPARDRSTMHDMASSTGISVSTLCRQLKSGTINRRSSRLKPLLTDTNKIERLAFCRDHVNIQLDVMNDYLSSRARDAAGAVESREPAESPGTAEFDFSDMWDVVHLDEKWFNADKDCRKTYLTRREVHERRACKSKRFIPKVKFLAAVARPRLDEGFDGKLVEKTPARRNSRNRPAGTLVTALVNVDGKTYRDYVITKHDNATPHGSIDVGTLAAVSTDGWTFVVRRQPPNSPDLNVLDLGFFTSIQALQYKMASRSMDDVIEATLSAFEAVMRLVMEHHGDNNFKLPHLKKDTLRRAGTLMANVTYPASLLFHVNTFLQQSSP